MSRDMTKAQTVRGHSQNQLHAAELNKKAFIEAFVKIGTVTHAAQAVGISRGLVYYWLEKDPEFADAYQDAVGQRNDILEAELHRRAVEGIEQPLAWDKEGKVLLTKKTPSDLLLMFQMKAAMPEKYREKVDSVHSGTVSFRLVYDTPPQLDTPQVRVIEAPQEDRT